MNKPVLFIAEAGVNHNGSIERALQLVDAAADAGADVVKFQTFKAELLATAGAAKADYQVANTGEAGSQLAMLRALELSPHDHEVLLAHCQRRGIRFMSTAFDAASLALLAPLNMPAIKIPSGDINCGPLLLQAARLRQPLIVSSGMATLADIEQALGVIAFGLLGDAEPSGRADFDLAYCSAAGRAALAAHVTLLHCVTQYPAPAGAVNLRAMDTMAAAFGLPVGYSDHTLGIEVSIAAVARGACVIEKHFTLDRSLPGPDHAASLEPQELRQLVAAIRNVEQALGSPLKQPAPLEVPNRAVARRSLVAARAIAAGEIFRADMLTAKRPGGGISPLEFWAMLGRRAQRAYAADELIEA
ncbi:N-acetylneuraminate synthase [Janthinobacterium fluminis]|uniref:N-acetylneuraminate synthase n=1 Tax=Janthinobacterium fluminis TaxID=2987524 RepID=A0ABT5K2C6_9BURK|nr:N-acetylneuraminate synthase [Janthinobacterium fluminis]MDC8758886.1 N-acetylneuraminate synthase [Janthinobacterium fluminis]